MERLQSPPTVQTDYDRERRLYDDTTTWLAEVLDGSMRTPFEYRFDGRELYAQDGSALKPIFADALSEARAISNSNSNLVFELRRRSIEFEEYEDMIAMARGDLPNTMVVVSDFPPELMAAVHDVGGYNALRKQTMLRVITVTDGKIRMRSQSLDGSDRRALEAIYEHLGYKPEAGELLGQRMHLELSLEDQEFLTDTLMGVYDRALTRQYGGNWYAGRRGQPFVNTYDFVRAQTDLLDAYTAACEAYPGRRDTLLHGLAAAMQNRYAREPVNWHEGQEYMAHGGRIERALWEMNRASMQAHRTGKTFSGCGLSLGSKDEAAALNELSEAGFGNQTDKETKYGFDKHMHCVVCQAPPKKGETKKMCGPCGICKDCDRKLKK